jgi:aspartokinase-like uncharacterized kinase
MGGDAMTPGDRPRLSGVLLVCGGRNYADRARLEQALDRVAERVDITALRHGDAWGADRLAHGWAVSRGVTAQPRPAEWMRGKGSTAYNKAAGVQRNANMLAEGGVVACVAFPGGAGTADMVRRCEAAGVPVWKVPA